MKNKILISARLFISTLVIMSLLAAFAGVAAGASGNDIFENDNISSEDQLFVHGEILVKFKLGIPEAIIDKINSKHSTSFLQRSPWGYMRLRIPKGRSVSEMVEIFSRNPNVEYAQPNSICRAVMTPTDPYYSLQWHLDNPEYGGINMEDAWNLSTGSGVIVAVLDTGVAYENYDEDGDGDLDYWQAPDLANTVFVAGYDFINNDTHPNDDESHGTHVTGTIAQSTNNGLGVAGVAFNAAIMPVKVLDSGGSGTAYTVADGIHFAADNGADVINMSLGWPWWFGRMYDPGPVVHDAVTYAYNKGVTLVAAAGNDSQNQVAYPAAYEECIAVGATQYDESLAPYTNKGTALDLTAPGGNLKIDQNNDGYGDGVLQQTFNPNTQNRADFGYWFFHGTSMAAPHVSGVAALVIATGVSGPDNVRSVMQTTAEDHGSAGWDRDYGWGIVDAYKALSSIGPPNNPPTANNQSVTTDEDTATGIILTASDLDNEPLTYIIASLPAAGSLMEGTAIITSAPYTLAGDNVNYIPNADYNGSDSLTFKANDGKADSNIATVDITINAVNDAPVADFQSVETSQDIAVGITLTGSDVDNDAIISNQPTAPANGSLALDANYATNGRLTYTPDPGFVGSDSFTFTVSDAILESAPATVSITVTEVNHPPVADDQSVTMNEDPDTPVAITLTASDPDGDTLTYTLVTAPSSGGLSGTPPNLTYTPDLNFNGTDSFTFKANDGQLDSNIATVSITVNPINDPPKIISTPVTTATEGVPYTYDVEAADPDVGDILTYSLTIAPSGMTIDSATGLIHWTPTSGQVGDHPVTIKVEDNGSPVGSDTQSFAITVSPAAPATQEFSFYGTIGNKQEVRHTVTIFAPGATSMTVKLTWSGRADLVLRIYNPSGELVKQVDESNWRNRVEETTIENLAPGDWQVAAYAKRSWNTASYTLEGVISY